MTNTESTEYQIRIDALIALQQLAELTTATRSFTTQLEITRAVVKEFARDTGMSFGQAKKVLSEADALISKTATSSTVFGGRGQDAWNKVGEAAEKAGGKMSFAMKAVNIAIGMLIHQGVNLLINTFQNLFNMAIKGLNEMEASMFNIANAEERLSKQGIDIKIEGLEKIIKDVQELDPMLSKFQATELVSVLSSKVAPALNLTEGEMARLANVITVLAVRNQALGKSFEEVQNQVVTGILSGRVTSGINQLGAKITEQAVQEEAVRLGLVRTTEAYKELNSQAKERIDLLSIMSILEANTESELKNLPKFMQSASGLIGTAKAELSDLMTSIGTVMSPIIKSVLKVIIGFLEQLNQWLIKNQASLMGIAGAIGQLIESPAVIKAIELGFKLLLAGLTAVSSAIARVAEGLTWLGTKVPWVKTLMDKLGGQTTFEDTPTATGLVPDISGQAKKEAEETKDVMAEIQDIMQDNADKLADMAQDYQNKIQDIEMDGRRKFADIARDRARDLEDAERDYQQSIADIEQESAESQQEARLEYQRSEEDAEREHQDRLAELREKYLMDLEEALHERDARQILRLMRQYQIDRNNAVQERQQDRQNNQAELQQTLQDLEIEKQEKLRKAREELEEKRAEIELNAKRERQDAAIAQGRALQDARIAHNRALAEQREYLQRKLRDLATALQAEYNMTAAQANAMVQLMANMYDTLGGLQTGFVSTTNSIAASTIGSTPNGTAASTIGSVGNASSPSSINAGTYNGGLAEGGSFLAMTPTSINVGENRPELITATPLGRPGRDVGKLFSNIGEGGGGGSMEIALTLSPDLEARIVRNSMDATANAIVRINKSKVR